MCTFKLQFIAAHPSGADKALYRPRSWPLLMCICWMGTKLDLNVIWMTCGQSGTEETCCLCSRELRTRGQRFFAQGAFCRRQKDDGLGTVKFPAWRCEADRVTIKVISGRLLRADTKGEKR